MRPAWRQPTSDPTCEEAIAAASGDLTAGCGGAQPINQLNNGLFL